MSFAEEPGFVVELAEANAAAFEAAARALGARAGRLGTVVLGPAATLTSAGEHHVLALDEALFARWRDALEDAFDVGEEAIP